MLTGKCWNNCKYWVLHLNFDPGSSVVGRSWMLPTQQETRPSNWVVTYRSWASPSLSVSASYGTLMIVDHLNGWSCSSILVRSEIQCLFQELLLSKLFCDLLFQWERITVWSSARSLISLRSPPCDRQQCLHKYFSNYEWINWVWVGVYCFLCMKHLFFGLSVICI